LKVPSSSGINDALHQKIFLTVSTLEGELGVVLVGIVEHLIECTLS
jgi:hypothetical protein